ncbi:hypothetical protein ACQPYK_50215 (plasmid) [Streptosporangium sp. CA-135522]|uniref:hypothetical protein n=1 Tax=Streptosporangium sp. CA-135522 TaxID=3240072 RepID=UPI003D8A086F
MTDTEPTAERAIDEGVVLLAVRQDGRWITRADAHGIVVHGRTLRELQASAQQALALRCGTQAAPPMQVRPQSAELDALAAARLRYEAALRHTVQTLRADQSSWTDIAQACHVRIADAQAALRQGPG